MLVLREGHVIFHHTHRSHIAPVAAAETLCYHKKKRHSDPLPKMAKYNQDIFYQPATRQQEVTIYHVLLTCNRLIISFATLPENLLTANIIF